MQIRKHSDKNAVLHGGYY